MSTMNVGASTSGQSNRRNSKKHNNYTALNVLVAGSVVNVYGVIKFHKAPIKTKGNDYCLVVSIIDQSLHEEWKKLKCILFERVESNLPDIKVGQIIRFHRLKINHFCGELQGQSGPGFSWLVFEPTEDDEVEPLSSSSLSYTFTDFDRERVIELSQWIRRDHPDIDSHKKCVVLSNISPDLYFNLICQVIAVYVIQEGVCFLVRVWDGTHSLYPVREVNIEDATNGQMDEDLMKRASGMVYDIYMYEDHFINAHAQIKPGQFLKIINLHAVIFTGCANRGLPSLPTLELSLHKGTAFNRGFSVLNNDCEEVQNLKKTLDTVVIQSNLQSSNITSSSVTHSINNNDDDIIISPNDSNTTDQSSIVFSCEMHSQESSQNSSSNRCMLETSTVILHHHHISPTKIKDILDHSVPYKFRLHAKIVDFEPKPDTLENFFRMYCPLCEITFNIDGSCEKCDSMRKSVNEDERHNSGELELVYMLRCLLQDSTGWLIANIWRDDAVKFFRSVHPRDIQCNPEKLTEVREDLDRICPNTDYSEKPWIDCCLKSYRGVTGTCYQIFDTCLV